MRTLLAVFCAGLLIAPAAAAPKRNEKVFAAVQANRDGFLALLRDIVNIDSGTGDVAGGAKVTALLAERLKDLPRDRPILVYCAGGYRSSIAAGLLQQHGVTDVIELASGIAAWERAGLPVRRSATAS